MAHPSDAAKEPFMQSDHQRQRLNHQASNVSALTIVTASLYDGPAEQQSRLHARESLVSLDSRLTYAGNDDDGNYTRQGVPSSWTVSFPYPGAPTTCSRVPPSPGVGDGKRSLPARALSRVGRRASSRRHSLRHRPTQEAIDEEEYDLSLLASAEPVDGAYETIREQDEHDDQVPSTPTVFDVGNALGPMGAQDNEFLRKLWEQESSGHLTGGIGQGFRAESRLRDADILSSPTAVQRSLSRSFSRHLSAGDRVGRRQVISSIGQEEANRRGEVIEVMHEGTGTPAAAAAESIADLSTLGGPDHIVPDEARSRSRTVSTGGPSPNRSSTELFYPQPNWKPVSMRWPYLLLLVVLSVGLGAMQELLFRTYDGDRPLVRFVSPGDVEPGTYFLVKFGPTIAAVFFGVLWQFTDFEVRRFEAYYQMSRPGGALAAESINVDYMTSFSLLRPVGALRVGHYAVALSSLATTLAASLVPTFAAASLVLTPDRHQRAADLDRVKEIRISGVFSRLLTSTLCVCAASGAGLLWLLQRRRSGLAGDVRGIAGLASMAVVSHMLMDFRDLDTANPEDVHHRLKGHRYILRNSSLAPDDENPPSTAERNKYTESHLPGNPHPLMLRPAGGLPFIASLLAFMGFIPLFLFTAADVVTDKASWVVTALAVALKLAWGSLETAVRMMEPYYILSRRHAPSKTLTLDYTALPFGYMPMRALFNGHVLVFLVGFGTVMAEFLTILVTGLASVDGRDFLMSQDELHSHADQQRRTRDGDGDGGTAVGRRDHADEDLDIVGSGQETLQSFYVSFGLAMFILLYMTGVATTVFLRRRHPFLPRQPNTIASVLAFIHQSKMLYSFVGTAKISRRELVQRLAAQEATYGLGWFIGRDGQVHCGVDREELRSDYKHGVDVSMGVQPWTSKWDQL
ncbi:Protein of unknown function (DUF3433) [Geosmithia morbida]|uniref:Spray n=1 Tax=Geosmithia morbida TaxID=1094350 RepID=A0A9P5D325_9HYPO|nr:Protein of unknown function (DUF3433) [Geosmithia morbida]KAF4125733.1 Protein of unknown function (DUF3433) [Geosmithia morbida]